jgi:transaldolase
MHVADCARAGADICTLPLKVLKQMALHPLTDKGIAAFTADWAKLQEERGAGKAAAAG